MLSGMWHALMSGSSSELDVAWPVKAVFCHCSVKVYTSQLLRGAFNALMSVARDEAALGLNVCSLTGKSMLRFFELSAWFMQYCRYQEEARAKDGSKT